MLVELWVPDDSPDRSLIPEADGDGPVQALLVLVGHGEHDGNGLVAEAIVQEAVEVLALKELLLPHEAGEGTGPAFGQHL